MKVIFVGSSTEALPYAQALCEDLAIPNVQAKLWDKFFKPGFVPLEAIDLVSEECSGALFLASPDDAGVIRGRQVRMPRANILLELGVLSGRFGRSSIALCRFEDVELPTDLSGFTYVNMGAFAPVQAKSQVNIPVAAVKKIQEWASDLQDTTAPIPRSITVHGYSGRWRVRLTFEKWRGFDISEPSYVVVNGYLNLFIPNSGQRGEGIAHGEMSVRLTDLSGKHQEFTATVRVADLILDLHCFPDGSIRFASETFVRNVMEQSGAPWAANVVSPVFPAANTFNWLLHPDDSKAQTLSGIYGTDDERTSKASVIATKV